MDKTQCLKFSVLLMSLLVVISIFFLPGMNSFAQKNIATATNSINVNQATVEQLSEIKGLGSQKAKRIVNHREQQGAFKSLDDLLQIKGIGSKLLAHIRKQLVV